MALILMGGHTPSTPTVQLGRHAGPQPAVSGWPVLSGARASALGSWPAAAHAGDVLTTSRCASGRRVDKVCTATRALCPFEGPELV